MLYYIILSFDMLCSIDLCYYFVNSICPKYSHTSTRLSKLEPCLAWWSWITVNTEHNSIFVSVLQLLITIIVTHALISVLKQMYHVSLLNSYSSSSSWHDQWKFQCGLNSDDNQCALVYFLFTCNFLSRFV